MRRTRAPPLLPPPPHPHTPYYSERRRQCRRQCRRHMVTAGAGLGYWEPDTCGHAVVTLSKVNSLMGGPIVSVSVSPTGADEKGGWDIAHEWASYIDNNTLPMYAGAQPHAAVRAQPHKMARLDSISLQRVVHCMRAMHHLPCHAFLHMCASLGHMHVHNTCVCIAIAWACSAHCMHGSPAHVYVQVGAPGRARVIASGGASPHVHDHLPGPERGCRPPSCCGVAARKWYKHAPTPTPVPVAATGAAHVICGAIVSGGGPPPRNPPAHTRAPRLLRRPPARGCCARGARRCEQPAQAAAARGCGVQRRRRRRRDASSTHARNTRCAAPGLEAPPSPLRPARPPSPNERLRSRARLAVRWGCAPAGTTTPRRRSMAFPGPNWTGWTSPTARRSSPRC